MGVLSLHNECPPLDYGPDTSAICQGLVTGEEGTSAMLKSLSDCIDALAAMDETVRDIVGLWGAAGSEDGFEANANPQGSYARAFESLDRTVERIDVAVQKYRDLEDYAQDAWEAGRGVAFQAALTSASDGDDFETLIDRRVELLRKLKVRVQILQTLQDHGLQLLERYAFPEFFLMFMQPIRDMAIAVQELYDEVVRGALASHQALFRACTLQGEGEQESMTLDDAFQQPQPQQVG